MTESTTLGSLEKKVMDCVWEGRGKTVREVYESLKESRNIAYTTIMTIMTRLVDKGFLTRKKVERAFVYSSKRNRKQAVKGVVRRVFESMVNQFGQEAVVAFSDELKKVSKRGRK